MEIRHHHQAIAYIAAALPNAKNRYAKTKLEILGAYFHYLNGKTHEASPSNGAIAALVCVSESTVERTISYFTKSGFITSKARYNNSSIRFFDVSKLRVTVEGLTVTTNVVTKNKTINSIEDIFAQSVRAMQSACKRLGYNIARKAIKRAQSSTKKSYQERKAERNKVEAKRIAEERMKMYDKEAKIEQPKFKKGSFDPSELRKRLFKRGSSEKR